MNCRHSKSWLIANGHYEWCKMCGALRPLVVTSENSCTLHPEKSWAHPNPVNPPTGFGKRSRKLKGVTR